MEEKRILVSLGGRVGRDEKLKSWKCKFDLTDPNVWIQLVLVILVLGFGASTIVLATTQDNCHAPPPSSPSPNTTSLAQIPLLGDCTQWKPEKVPNTISLNNYLGAEQYCVFRTSASTYQSILSYTALANTIMGDCMDYCSNLDTEGIAPPLRKELVTAFDNMIDNLKSDGFSFSDDLNVNWGWLKDYGGGIVDIFGGVNVPIQFFKDIDVHYKNVHLSCPGSESQAWFSPMAYSSTFAMFSCSSR